MKMAPPILQVSLLEAIDGLRVSADGTSIKKQLSRYALGDIVDIHVFRRDELMKLPATLISEDAPQYTLTIQENASENQLAARKQWLG